jgi:DNA primase
MRISAELLIPLKADRRHMAKGGIHTDDIAILKDRLVIEDIIGEVVTLRRIGTLYRGLCPFHDDSRPSFDVSAERKMYICRSQCGSGDVFNFIQETKNLSFVESVEYLADKIGMQLRYVGGEKAAENTSKRKALIAANKEALEFYKKQLQNADASVGMQYLSERQFTQEDIIEFDIGYAPTGWDTLLSYLKDKGHSEQNIIDAGLAIKNDNGKVYDRFRDRLTWAIYNNTGEPVGFGARKLSESDQGPKWLNTPETAVYKKSEVLYGLSKARAAIGKDQIAVIVEGYGDVMACHLSGVPYAVATCGTAFATSHVNMIRRLIRDGDSYKGKVIFTFDGDTAGKQAAMRVFLKDNNKFASQTYVAVAPEGMDPLDLRISKGSAAVKALIDNAIPLVEFVLDQKLEEYNLASSEGKVNAMRAILPILSDIKDPLLQQEYLRKSAGLIGLIETDVRKAFTTFQKSVVKNDVAKEYEEPKEPNSALDALPNPLDSKLRDEREIIKILFQAKTTYKVDLYSGAFKSEFYGKLFSKYELLAPDSDPGTWLENGARGTVEESYIAGLLMEPTMLVKEEDREGYLENLSYSILFSDAERKIAVKKLIIPTLTDKPEELTEIMKEILALEGFKRSLRK